MLSDIEDWRNGITHNQFPFYQINADLMSITDFFQKRVNYSAYIVSLCDVKPNKVTLTKQ